MALIKCSECGQMVSDKASMCPNCGCPVNSNDGNGILGAHMESQPTDKDEMFVSASSKAHKVNCPQSGINKKMVWGLIASVVLVFIIIVATTVNRDSDEVSYSSNSGYASSYSFEEESSDESDNKENSYSSSSSSTSSSRSFSSEANSSSMDFVGTYEFTDKINTTWVLVLNSDETATIRTQNGSREAYGSWKYYKFKGYPSIWFMDEEPLIWFPSGEERSYHLCVKDSYIYLGDNALEAKNPRKRLSYRKNN